MPANTVSSPSAPLAKPPVFTPKVYPRRVLVAVCGLSPQIVTETVYALTVSSPSPWVPTEVRLITTAQGAQKAIQSLLPCGDDWFGRLCREYDLPPMAFDASHIHVVEDESGEDIEDIRTPQENQMAADYITTHIRDLAADADCALHVSIAGGRKTMGFYMGYALSLYGRAQDQLSHVLVNPPFEYIPTFYYPPKSPRKLDLTGDRGQADTADAVVTLASIPFVRMDRGAPVDLLKGRVTFNEAVAAVQAELEPPRLVIDRRGKRIRAGTKVVKLSLNQTALMAMFARRLLEGRGPATPVPGARKNRDLCTDFQAELDACKKMADNRDKTEDALAYGMKSEWLSVQKTRLENRLHQELGYAAIHYLIADETKGKGTERRLALTLPVESVSFASV